MKAFALLVLMTVTASAHSWYAPECCSGNDCQPVADEDVVEIDNGGWKYLPTGNVFRNDKTMPQRIRPSQDSHFHVCIHNGYSYCIYIKTGM